MSSNENDQVFKDYVPKVGLIYHKEFPQLVFCKPKLMPLKSLTLERLEKLQQDSDKALKKAKTAQRTN